ncbi:MAG: ribose 5-phosphate isomerase B [Flavobacteriaceae bacterium]|nr:ribose 5-phosphate isomerase B [Flavobacteriaceae bacterium]
MKIYIGNDHAGVRYKIKIVEELRKKNIEVINKGTDKEESVDYPDFIHPVAKKINEEKKSVGIVICGSGNGAAMTANKYKEVRASICWNKKITKLARKHNNSNILSIPSRFISMKEATEIVEIFLKTKFEGGRHLNRIKKIPCK